ncbi:MAG: DNA polymerase I [Clostridia bacterium]|nr:DNA polymerase I [Clostridia bacterium]
MSKLLLIDGNSIMNRAFYGIMGSKMLMTKDGKYTNAVYGFLAIMFKIMDELKPDYMAVSFDLKGPTARHKMYSEYKANRHGMPNELAEQMPMIKEILQAMNIDIVQKEGYEGDDILGTLAKYAEEKGIDVTILSGDRDTFQLASNKVTIRIPRTKAGKTETEDYDKNKVLEEYGLEPKKLIDVKGLQGDTSDNIPGVPGIGAKTAINLIKKFGSIEKLYQAIDDGNDDLKGKQRENIINNREIALLSKELGTINTNVPLEDTLENLKIEEWDRQKVLDIFKELNFKRYIERFNLSDDITPEEKRDLKNLFKINDTISVNDVTKKVKELGKIVYYFGLEDTQKPEQIIKSDITSICIYNYKEKEVYFIKNQDNEFINMIKEIFEDENIEKYGYEINYMYIILKQMGITPKNIKYDVTVAAYILNPSDGKYPIDGLCEQYLEMSVEEYLALNGAEEQDKQINLFDINTSNEEKDINKYRQAFYAYSIWNLAEVMTPKLKEINAIKLFEEIDMPTIEVLCEMQWNGMHVKEDELNEFGKVLKDGIDLLTQEIYNLAGEEFNINSPKQLGEILFEKMNLPVIKKTKNGYSTDVDVLEKLKKEHAIIEKILDYRQLSKLNSTYVEGLKPYINPVSKRIHSFFHQTITATGRISSTEPNLQNIPTRIEFGKRLRKVFKPEDGNVYIDADYSQIELRVLAHLSKDEHMINAFKHGEDIHKQAASKVFNIPIEEVTKEQRSSAKAVNFGIVYGISDFGLGEQLGIGRKQAKEYIEQYLTEYSGIRNFMNTSIENAKSLGYAETLFNRRRNIKELTSNNYMVRQFGERAAMNTPVQGTAADIMKIAMINVYNELKKKGLKSKIVLQVHDEMMIESPKDEVEEVKTLIKECMENAAKLDVPLVVDVSEAPNWYECK